MKKQAKDLTEKQKEIFEEAFMEAADERFELADDCGCRWTCPWDWCPDKELIGDTVEEMAVNFYKEHEKEIVELLDIDEEMRKELQEDM